VLTAMRAARARRGHLTLMVGAVLALAAVLRLGFLANFISEPVLSGFKAGIGVVIVLDQVPKLLGVLFPKGTFLQISSRCCRACAHVRPHALRRRRDARACLLGLKRFVPSVPAPLVTVGAGIAAWRCSGSRPTA